MSLFSDICHCGIIRELFQELTNDVTLLTFDGMAIYGKIQRIDDRRIVVLTPASGQIAVLTLTPGGAVLRDAYATIDACTIVGKITGVTQCPFSVDLPTANTTS